MPKYTKLDIEKMVDKIVSFLKENEFDDSVCIFYNNKRLLLEDGIVEDNVNPHDYFEYAADQHIISMSFEGMLYDLLNDSFDDSLEEEFRTLLDDYGIYYELGNSWNLSYYPSSADIEDFEYTDYESKKEQAPIRFSIYNKGTLPEKIEKVVDLWHKLVQIYGTNGSCVTGDGIKFTYQGNTYFMNTNYNQSDSVEHVIEETKRALEYIGATEIRYDWGHMG